MKFFKNYFSALVLSVGLIQGSASVAEELGACEVKTVGLLVNSTVDLTRIENLKALELQPNEQRELGDGVKYVFSVISKSPEECFQLGFKLLKEEQLSIIKPHWELIFLSTKVSFSELLVTYISGTDSQTIRLLKSDN